MQNALVASTAHEIFIGAQADQGLHQYLAITENAITEVL
jgi:hypothetical protein